MTPSRAAVLSLFLATACEPQQSVLTVMTPDAGTQTPMNMNADCLDNDGDGVPGTGACSQVTVFDCDDTDSQAHPGAAERCNGLDDDCDREIDEGVPVKAWFVDADGDGAGSSRAAGMSCRAPMAGAVDNGGDCDDTNADVHPGAAETCNHVDDDCDGQADDGLPSQSYFPDLDGDGFGARTATAQVSCSPVQGKVTNSDDCNDGNDMAKPGATETCNGADDDCDNQVDEGLPTTNYYPDLDADGFGAAGAIAQPSCTPVTGKVTSSNDCNDRDLAVHPGATEYCDGVDQDCDTQIDEGVQTLNWYVDADGDGHGAPNSTPVQACRPQAGRASNNDDCNDGVRTIYPGSPEVCDGVDQDCDTQVDEGLATTAWYPDADGDGVGAANGTPVQNCRAPAGRVATNTDCNDGNRAVFPGAAEACNGLDDDCDNTADENNPGGGAACTTSEQGVCRAGTITCQAAQLRCVRNVGPSTELCDSLDNDCDGQTDETFADKGQACSAGLGVCLRTGVKVCAAAGTSTVCNATPGDAEPSACDGRDNDCDGTVDEPALGATAQIHPNPWQDVEVEPYYFSSSGCAGGVNGSGADTLAGGGASVSVQPGVGGIRYLQLDVNGAPVDLTWILSGTYQYLDADIAQAGDGFIVAGVFTPRAEIDVYYRSQAGAVRATLESQLRPATGNSIDSLRLVRGNGRRVVLLWRETGTATASTGLKLAEVEPVLSGTTWTLRDARTQAATLSAVTLVPGAIAAGLGADSSHVDWDTTQTCQPTATQRLLGVAYLSDALTLKHFTVLENGTSKSTETTVRTETGSHVLGEPEVTYFQSAGADQWFVAYTTSDTAMGAEDLNYWLTTNPVYALAYSQPATANGADSVSRPRASVSGGRIWLTALRDVADASGFKRQVAARWISFAGAKDPLVSTVEIPFSKGACLTGQTDCRPGDKGGLGSWAAKGKLFYSANGSTPAASFTSTLSCD